MGNWCTVSLRGTLAAEHVDAVREFVTVLFGRIRDQVTEAGWTA